MRGDSDRRVVINFARPGPAIDTERMQLEMLIPNGSPVGAIATSMGATFFAIKLVAMLGAVTPMGCASWTSRPSTSCKWQSRHRKNGGFSQNDLRISGRVPVIARRDF